jgi:hypothetical protein
LTQRFHTLSREHANQTAMLNTLRSVLTKADETIDALLKAKDENQPIGQQQQASVRYFAS